MWTGPLYILSCKYIQQSLKSILIVSYKIPCFYPWLHLFSCVLVFCYRKPWIANLEIILVVFEYHISFGCLSPSFYFPGYLGLRIQQRGGIQFDLSFGKRNWIERLLPNNIFSLTPGVYSLVWSDLPFPRNGPNF